ncbi:hypothetical protein M670_00417 [Schinkia azotoformans MEV2011]|uniref:Uncharacterized protein n=1 Tax=Schinkia azotoformans MEV2011 TaxID=1348973 RepID=A0A072NSC4_SCHAZ|nr:hypothetical protein M670_00417 [Schinkia azotoformans MEV2011]
MYSKQRSYCTNGPYCAAKHLKNGCIFYVQKGVIFINIIYLPFFLVLLICILTLVSILVYNKTKDELLVFSSIGFTWGLIVVPYLLFLG